MIEFFFVNFTHAFTLFGRYLVLIACFSARGYTDDNRMAYGFLTGFFLSLSIRKFLYINYSIFEFIELRNVDSEQVENLYSHHWFPILRLSSWSIYIHTNRIPSDILTINVVVFKCPKKNAFTYNGHDDSRSVSFLWEKNCKGM